jgi:hypothetical protein
MVCPGFVVQFVMLADQVSECAAIYHEAWEAAVVSPDVFE